MNLMEQYYQTINRKMKDVISLQGETIQQAAQLMSDCADVHHVYFFGTGHSYIIGQEVFARAGGYAKFIPILEDELGMNHAFKSTLIERMSDYADVILGLYAFEAGDVIIMTSNSGRNALIVELALRLKQMGVKIIALTALSESKQAESRHHSGLKLFELADIVLDNYSCYGDASLKHNEEVITGPTSTIMGCYIIQLLVSAFVQLEIDKGKEVPVFKSSNVDEGDAYNEHLFDFYR